MVTLTNVTKTYFDHSVLKGVNLQIKKGDFLYLIGGSGAGKSTFLRLLATEEAPSLGEVALFGYSLSRVTPSTLNSIRRAVGYIPQNIRLIPDLSVYDNISLSVALSGRKTQQWKIRSKIGELLELFSLTEKKDYLCKFLSGGEAQRVAIARALIRNPEMIIADEPTGAQDRNFTWLLMDLFQKANLKGTTVIVATHDREIVRRVRRPCVNLKDGRVVIGENSCTY